MNTRVKMTYVLPFLLVLLLFKPMIVTKYHTIDMFFSLALNIVLFATLTFWAKIKFRTSIWLRNTLIFFILIILSTIINGGEVLPTIILYAKLFISCLLIEIMILKYKQRMISIFINALFILVLLNLGTLILMPKGVLQVERFVNEWYQYRVAWWLFGNKNSMFFWLMPTNVLAQIRIIQNRTRKESNIFNYVVIFATLLTAFISQSSTTIFVIGLISIFIFSSKLLEKLRRFMDLDKYLIVYFLLTILLLTFTQLDLFSFIAKAFGKDATFTGRVFAWQQSIILVIQKPFLGYGSLSEESWRVMLGAYSFTNAHNTLLQILLNGGFTLLAMFYILIKNIASNLKSLINEYLKYRLFCEWFVFGLLIHMSFESVLDSALFWMTLTIIFNVPNLLLKHERRLIYVKWNSRPDHVR